MFGNLARQSCQRFHLPSVLQAKRLADISVYLSTDTSPQNKTTQQKIGALRPEGNAAISSPKKIRLAVFGSSPEGARSESSVLLNMARVGGWD
jgi:hypothetical protein